MYWTTYSCRVDTPRGPGQRAGLTRSAVLAAAREVLAEGGGVEALTMRALARRLHVAPNALYSHVTSKTALLDDLLDDLLASVPAPQQGSTDPVDGLTQLMTSTYAVLTAHPDLVPFYLARQGSRGPHAVALGQVMDALLTAAGVSGPDTATARHVLIIHAIGSAAFAAGASPEAGAVRPLSVEDSKNTFSRSLSWLLAGIAQDSHDGQSERPDES